MQVWLKSGIQLPKLRAGSQSACVMAVNPWEEENGKTTSNLYWHSTQRHQAQDLR